MIHSLFILSNSGEILMEKHWRGTISRTVGDEFWGLVVKASSPTEVNPIIATSRYYLVHVLRSGLFFLGVLQGEAPPLMALELLDRIAALFTEYLGTLTEDNLKDNFVTCYQLLEEMVDNGFPVTTEPTVLKDLVPPPTVLNKLRNVMQSATQSGSPSSSTGTTASSLEASPVPWRKSGVRYANNEIFFDIVEELDCIIDNNGQLVTSELHGRIEANSRLSGMPDVLCSFMNASILEDVCFHPCVRFARYEQDRSLSFVPPDGVFELMRYRTPFTNTAPFYITPSLSFHKEHGRVNIIVGLRGGGRDIPEKGVQEVKITIQLPQTTESAKLEVTQGSYHFDTVTKELRWDIGRISTQRSPSMNGSFSSAPGTSFPDGSSPSVLVDFRLPMHALSGLKIDTVSITNERYKPYKGVRSLSKAGVYEIRTVGSN
eukprot:TRINITY_DN4048_c0_g1_i1.p1 TRINITY_DN4048_c0_g1~~TRINITY_DN4048_c0_g1_i1.p1  ORF type:complete len:441 (+),score=88.40 TRINITY_DN4048_c0_g1_i1:32-1324(+)